MMNNGEMLSKVHLHNPLSSPIYRPWEWDNYSFVCLACFIEGLVFAPNFSSNNVGPVVFEMMKLDPPVRLIQTNHLFCLCGIVLNLLKIGLDIELVRTTGYGSITLNCSNWDETVLKPLK